MSSENIVHLKIAQGEGFREIAAHLSQDALIRSIGVFKIYALISGRAQRFLPGVYELSPIMSVPQIVDAITTGGRNEITLTIPEGSTAKDIDQMLKSSGVLEGNATILDFPIQKYADRYPFLADATSLEGFVFPDTYRFRINASVEDTARVMLDTFLTKAWPQLQGQSDWYNRLKLASLLEREVPGFDDRQIVAGIFLKRVRLGIPLQADATISYAKCGGALRNCTDALITRKDLTLVSPYNTYQKLGWMPTPISNPGQSAIAAAVQPKSSPYLYYLSAAKTKETIFARTLDEQNSNRQRYL